MTEGQLQDEIRLALNHERGCWWRNNIGTAILPNGARVKFGIGNPGGADLIGLYGGLFVALEIKTPTGRATSDQRLFRDLVERKGGVYRIVRSPDQAHELLAELETAIVPRPPLLGRP